MQNKIQMCLKIVICLVSVTISYLLPVLVKFVTLIKIKCSFLSIQTVMEQHHLAIF